MTTKQMLLSVLILGAMGNMTLGMNNPYHYPQLPKQQCDFCNFDIQQYEKAYKDAMNYEIESKFASEQYSKTTQVYNVMDLAMTLRFHLNTIEQQKKLCPEYIAAKRTKKSEQFANLISTLNHEQQ